jgi:hypothetical protein
MDKYYFITYITRRLGRQFLESIVSDKHPFNWLNGVQLETNNKIVLIGWQEISEEEYNMYPKLELKEDHTRTGTSRGNLNGLEDQDPSDLDDLES